ncbi:MAG: TetR family transcriptional regulator [Rhodoblastus sp.]|nr:TetR family transcriptional regulator [Rhodoblastus sp.]
MARTRSPKFEDIQLGILKKAARLFASHGYERTSIGDLVRACDLSRGAIYHYFESKEAILFAMMDSLVRGLLETLSEAAAEDGEPIERLQRIIAAFVETNARSPDEQKILLNDLGALSGVEQKQIHAIEKQVVELVADAIVAADTRGLVTPRTRKTYTMMLFGMINYTYTWYNAKGPVKPRELAEIATDLFFNGFAPDGAKAARRIMKAAEA